MTTRQAGATEQLIMALLSVGGYSLERVWKIFPGLREQRLLDSKQVIGADLGTVTKRLAAAGYDRGPSVTPMMAERLQILHKAIAGGALGRALSLLERGQDGKAEAELCGIKGIGQVVFRNFVALHRGE